MVETLFKRLYKWLDTNPQDVKEQCRKLHANEDKRPFGESIKFMNLISSLPISENEPECPAFIFHMKSISF